MFRRTWTDSADAPRIRRGAGALVVTAVGTLAVALLIEPSAGRAQVADPGAPAATAIELSSSPNPSTVGERITYTAMVTSGTRAVTVGTVEFAIETSSGGPGGGGAEPRRTVVGAAQLDGRGRAILSGSSTIAGIDTMWATYTGTDEFVASTAMTSHVVLEQRPASMTLSASPSPSSIGKPVTFVARMSPVPPAVSDSPGGTLFVRRLDFYVGTEAYTVDMNADGEATLTVSFDTAGIHRVIATHPGSTTLAGAAAVLYHEVDNSGPAATTTTLTSSPNPSAVGEPITLTATVSSRGAPVAKDGLVEFAYRHGDGSVTSLGTAAVDSNGQAALTATIPAAVGTQSIRASFLGTVDHAPSETVAQHVVLEQHPTVISISSSPNPSSKGDVVKLAAVVTAEGRPVTSGTVDFFIRNGQAVEIVAGGVQIGSDGTASVTLPMASPGIYVLWSSYNGTTMFRSSSAMVNHAVAVAAEPTTSTSSSTPSTTSTSSPASSTTATTASTSTTDPDTTEVTVPPTVTSVEPPTTSSEPDDTQITVPPTVTSTPVSIAPTTSPPCGSSGSSSGASVPTAPTSSTVEPTTSTIAAGSPTTAPATVATSDSTTETTTGATAPPTTDEPDETPPPTVAEASSTTAASTAQELITGSTSGPLGFRGAAGGFRVMCTRTAPTIPQQPSDPAQPASPRLSGGTPDFTTPDPRAVAPAQPAFAPPAPALTGTLPATGSGSSMMAAVVGLLLTAAGGGLVALAQRRPYPKHDRLPTVQAGLGDE